MSSPTAPNLDVTYNRCTDTFQVSGNRWTIALHNESQLTMFAAEVVYWKNRALDAEKRIADGLRALGIQK